MEAADMMEQESVVQLNQYLDSEQCLNTVTTQ